MTASPFRKVIFMLFVAVVLATSACGTLQIDTEPTVSENEVAGSAVEASREVMDEATPIPVETSPEEDAVEEVIEPPSKASEIIVLDETWKQFTDYRLGFSIRFPKEMATFRGSCTWKEDESSYRPETALVPVQIFEDADAVYIGAEHFYELTGERQEDGRAYYDECNIVTNSLELMQDPDAFKEPYWELVAEDVHNDAELDSFIKQRYGPGCSAGDQLPSVQDGVYDITIQGDGKGLEETQCPINYMTVVKYFPEGNKLVAWDRGQANYFPADVTYQVVYDQEMEDSFRFLTDSLAEAEEEPSETISYSNNEEVDGSGDETTVNNYQDWQLYSNEQLGYSLMVPGTAEVMALDPNDRVAFIGPEVDGKPQFQFMVVHYDLDTTEADNFMQDLAEGHRAFLESMGKPAEGQVEEMVIAGEPAIKLSFPAINGSDPRDDYFFVHDGTMFTLSITHFNGVEDKTLNDLFLQSITFEQS